MSKPKFLQGIDTIIIRVSDIKKAKHWYQEKLHLNATWEDENTKLVILNTNSETSITLWQTDEEITINKHSSTYPIFKTSNAQETFNNLINTGVLIEPIIEEQFVKYFIFYDLDDNILEVCEILS